MKGTTTKERILNAALALFSQKGYDGIGVDLIAEAAGIKGPSLYRHFSSKEEILNTLLTMGEEYYYQRLTQAVPNGHIPRSMDELSEHTMWRVRFVLDDPFLQQMRKLFAIEQYRSDRLGDLASRHYITLPENIYTYLFQEMMAAGIIKEGDPQFLAMEYTALITMMIHLCDRQPQRREEAIARIHAHLDYFTQCCKA